MTSYSDTKWPDDCFSRCGDCSPCLHFDNNNDSLQSLFSKRFTTVGSVRYGIRLGAVSPPPPGAGPRYRSQCCWPSASPGSSSRAPLFLGAPAPINSTDIFSCVTRLRIGDDDGGDADGGGGAAEAAAIASTSELSEQACAGHPDALQAVSSTTSCSSAVAAAAATAAARTLLKSHLRRRAAYVRPQVYARLCECRDRDADALIPPGARDNLDRLPRFRFGGNRSAASGKAAERDKRNSERLREFTDRLKKGPTSTRSKHDANIAVPSASLLPRERRAEDGGATVPFRSASFSQVDYSPENRKYVRRKPSADQQPHRPPSEDSLSQAALTLPRSRVQRREERDRLQSSAPAASAPLLPLPLTPSPPPPPPLPLSPSTTSTEHLESSRTCLLTLHSPPPSPLPRLDAVISAADADEVGDHEVTSVREKIYNECQEIKDSESLDDLAQDFRIFRCEEDECTFGTFGSGSITVRSNNDIVPSVAERKPASGYQRSAEEASERWDKSRRRKGMYISQWPHEAITTPTTAADVEDAALFASTSEISSKGDDVSSATLTEIPKLEVSSGEKVDDHNSAEMFWSSPQEEPQSPEDNRLSVSIEWPGVRGERPSRPSLSQQSSEERDSCTPNRKKELGSNFPRADSLSEGENDTISTERRGKTEDQFLCVASDLSDCEGRVANSGDSPRIPRRYSKRPLRGPYGQMLEAEMNKNEIGRKQQISNDLKFLEDLNNATVAFPSSTSLSSSSSVGAADPKPKCVARLRGSSDHSLDDSQIKISSGISSPVNTSKHTSASIPKRKVSVDCPTSVNNCENEERLVVSHQRTTSSPSKLEGLTSPSEPSNELLEQLLRGSSEHLTTCDAANLQKNKDTRTHVVVELYDTERSYVESLQILVTKYLEPLKNPDNTSLLDAVLVDEIFYQIPTLLNYHQVFLEELKRRLDQWDLKQKVGDIFLETFSKPSIIESYTNYVNNWKRAREIIKSAQQTKPAFARFLETTAREHKGKLALDSLLIKPIQKFPKYELLLQRLIKHTDPSHPDHGLLLQAQKEVHELLLKINCTEREALELEQLREIEGLIEGLMELVASDRQYLRHDLVSMAAGGGARKERALFLFSDLLLVTSIKRRSGTIRKPCAGQGSVTSTLEANKYKLLMRISLDDLEIVKAKDENLRQVMMEIENLTDDIAILNQISELAWSLHCSHAALDDVVKDMLEKLNRQLAEQQNSDSQLSCVDLTLNTSNGLENVSVVFSKPEKRASWEETFNEAKHKLAMSGDRRPCPELLATVPIRKTRAGLQFTCAAPTLTGDDRNDVWVCNSDGYVGQVCVLSLHPEPTVTSCNGVCNARIVCIASIPGVGSSSSSMDKRNCSREIKEEHSTIQFDSSSSSDEDEHSDVEESSLSAGVTAAVTAAGSSSSSSVSAEVTGTVSSCKGLIEGGADSDEAENQQSTMWLGTEDGCIHVYNSNDNIRIKKNKIRLQLGSSVLCIIYLDNKVFVSLANGDVTIYERDNSGGWNISNPTVITVGSTAMPVSKLLPNSGKLWCSCGNSVKVFNTVTLSTENSFTVNNDANKFINCMILAGNGLWLSLQNSAIIKCFHAYSFELLCEVNVAPAVTKMLTSCDDIIRQHKAACLRVTSLLACKDLLWIGTSAGVLLTMPLPHIASSTSKLNSIPSVTGVPYGHTGHVRFITHVESTNLGIESSIYHHHRYSYKGKQEQRNSSKVLVISGGDGYEDFRSSNLSEVAGREDSTNHLLLWNV